MRTAYQVDGSLQTAAARESESGHSGPARASGGDRHDSREGDVLRRKARDAIAAERLPSAEPTRMWGGPGIGVACVVCGETVRREEIGYELEFAGNGGAAEYHIHVPCFTAWQTERQPSNVAPTKRVTLLAAPHEGTMAGGERDSPNEQRRS